MDCSYPAVYESYAKFCTRIGQRPLLFEDWMKARDEGVEHKDLASDFLQASVPGLPVPACSPR